MSVVLSLAEKEDIVRTKVLNKNSFKKLAIYSHFSPYSRVDEYVIYAIKELFKLKFDIVFVTTSQKIHSSQLAKIEKYLCAIIVKKNRGYDFMSWKTGLNFLSDYKNYKTILCINDSIFFPLFNPTIMFETMEKKNLDFWGIYDGLVPQYYIQSFFWVFSANMIKSKIFENFWNECEILDDKSEIIRKYEFGFTTLALKNNYNVSSYIKTQDVLNKLKNDSLNNQKFENKSSFYFFWDTLIKDFKAPYIKKNILIPTSSSYNPTTLFWRDVLSEHTCYDTNLIEEKLCLDSCLKSEPAHINEFYKNVHILYEELYWLKNKKNIALYGLGEIGLIVLSYLYKSVTYVFDRNVKSYAKVSTTMPENINKVDFDYIVISAIGREKDIVCSISSVVPESKIVSFESKIVGESLGFANIFTKLVRNIEALYIAFEHNYQIVFYSNSDRLSTLLRSYLSYLNILVNVETKSESPDEIYFLLIEKKSFKQKRIKFYI